MYESSIDNFINKHQSNDDIVIACKIAIALAISSAESHSTLANIKDSTRHSPDKEDSWLTKFYRKLAERTTSENIERIFENVSFITFNYDRCLEEFLVQAISKNFMLARRRAEEIATLCPITHAYGLVAPLEGLNAAGQEFGCSEFGATLSDSDLAKAGDNIRTFYDGTSSDQIAKHEAKRLVFLGFGYHDMNMELIRKIFRKSSGSLQVLGTAYGISDHDRNALESKLRGFFPRCPPLLPLPSPHTSHDIVVLSNSHTGCGQFFDEFYHVLK